MWTLEEGLKFIRMCQPVAAAYGYNLSLGGGVLNSGKSEHDLDIVVAPAKDAMSCAEPFVEWLKSAHSLTEIKRRPWNRSMDLIKAKTENNRIIDFFFVR